MIKRIPLVALQKALISTLTTCQTTKVYNHIPTKTTGPYIKVGAFTCKPNGSKDVDISDVTSQIHIYSQHKGEIEVNEIANDIINVIGAVKLDLSEAGFIVMKQEYDFFESFETDANGYHGVITFVAKIQNIGA